MNTVFFRSCPISNLVRMAFFVFIIINFSSNLCPTAEQEVKDSDENLFLIQ